MAFDNGEGRMTRSNQPHTTKGAKVDRTKAPIVAAQAAQSGNPGAPEWTGGGDSYCDMNTVPSTSAPSIPLPSDIAYSRNSSVMERTTAYSDAASAFTSNEPDSDGDD